MIELQAVCKVYNPGRCNECTALRGVTLAIDKGSLTVLIGPSGSGKTTLLKILGGTARPTAGRVVCQGRELTALPERVLAGVRRQTFGFIFQHCNLIRGLSAIENVMVPAFPGEERRSQVEARAERLLAAFDLRHKALTKVEQLSGGEAQRVAITRALINDPAVLIADEPTAHLDSRLARDFMVTMQRLQGEGRTILIASHDPIVHDWAAVDRVIEIRDGYAVGRDLAA